MNLKEKLENIEYKKTRIYDALLKETKETLISFVISCLTLEEINELYQEIDSGDLLSNNKQK